MIIRFAKHANRPPTLNCVRDDGSATWFTASPGNAEFFVAHDLLHYAVEAILGYTSAFYGLVAAGRDLNDFGSTDGVKDARPLSLEAADTERLVGLIQALSAQGEPPTLNAITVAWAMTAAEESSAEAPLTEAQLAEICTVWGKLVQRWRTIGVGETLELAFPKPTVLQPTLTA
jgi:hypothetical protein